MKKLFFTISLLALVFGAIQAQDGKKDLRQATRSLNAYKLDSQSNPDKLQEATDAITSALEDPEIAAEAKAWNAKGEIFNLVATQLSAAAQLPGLDASNLPQVERPAMQAFHAYMTAYEKAEKKFETRDALKGLFAVQTNLYTEGVSLFQDKMEFAAAYEDFQAVLDAHNVLKKEGEDSFLDTEDYLTNQYFLIARAAITAEMYDKAKIALEELQNSGYEDPGLYDMLYKVAAQEDGEDAAYAILAKGREKYPDDTGLLFTDINYHIKYNKLDELITKLEEAISKEPENISLYQALGSTYDQLQQREMEAGNPEQAQMYFDKAMEVYQRGLEIDPNAFDIVYSMGVLYYNKAAAYSTEMQALADDFSKEGMKKYQELEQKVFEQFDKALPYFKRCEQINPNDVNTLIALKEIYAKKNELEISNEFKKRLETVQSGGSNESSYFN